MIKIVTDSTCDLPDELYQEYDISVVPINIQFGTETYLDRVTIDQTTFYQKIEESGTLPKTSQPSPGQFEERYRELADAGATDIISVHCTAKLSGTFRSAEMATETVKGRVRVQPFDGGGGSAGLGFMAVEAARMIANGQGVKEILDRMVVMRSRIEIILTLKDLKYAQMSGRVGRMQSSLASLLNVKPIAVLEDGVIDVAEKVRTRRKALERMIEMMAERVGASARANLAVVHAEAPDEAHALLDRAKSLINCQESFVTDLALSLAVQFGPGTLGLIGYRV